MTDETPVKRRRRAMPAPEIITPPGTDAALLGHPEMTLGHGGVTFPQTWPSIVREHGALLPRAPGPWLGSLTPGCPHITAERLENRLVTMGCILVTLDEAWAAYYGKPDPGRFEDYARRNISSCIPLMHEKGIFPAEWIWWNLHMYDNHVRVRAELAGTRVDRVPSSDWLFDRRRMAAHYGWYAHSPERRLGGLTTFTPDARAYGVEYFAMQQELCSSPTMPSANRVRGVTKLHFATLDAEVLAEAAARQAAKLRELADNWHFIWGT